MTKGQRDALFWTFLVLFIAIVIVSLLVAIQFGVFAQAAPTFQKLAVFTIIAGIVGAIFTVYRGAFAPGGDVFVTLDSQGKASEAVDLEQQGSYEVWDEQHGRVARRGSILAELGQGGWYCKLPGSVSLNDRVRLLFHERDGQEWEVRYFSPRFNRQPMVRQQGKNSASEGAR